MRKLTPSYRALLFDFDDTLIQTVHHNIPGWQNAAARANLPHRPEQIWRERWGGLPVELVRRVYDNKISEEQAKKVVSYKQNENERNFIPEVSGATKAISSLSERCILGIVTSRERFRQPFAQFTSRSGQPIYSLLEYRVDSSGFNLDDFAFMVGSDENEYHKPDPRVFNKPAALLQAHGVSINDAAYVGDDVTDWHASRDAGIPFYAVTSGVRTREDFIKEGCPPQNILSSIACLPTKILL